MDNPRHNTRDIFPATGTEITDKSWLTEAPLRMLMNNLDPDNAENPAELVVYGGTGKAARIQERAAEKGQAEGPKGSTAQAARAGMMVMMGPRKNRPLLAAAGVMISLKISLTASAIGVSRP